MHALRFRTFPTTWIGAVALVAAGFTTAVANAQEYKFKVAERSSLAWWQMSPHLGHLSRKVAAAASWAARTTACNSSRLYPVRSNLFLRFGGTANGDLSVRVRSHW